MLDRLMSRAIFTVAHRIMREYENGRQFHQGRKPNGRSRIINEDEESGPEAAQLGERHPVYDGTHRMLANPVMEISATIIVGLEMSCSFESQSSLVRRPEVCRASDEPWNILRQDVERFA